MPTLSISPSARPWLSLLAKHRVAPPSITVDMRALADAEDALRSVIPDDVVALLAIEGRSFVALVDLTQFIRAFYASGSQVNRPIFAHVAFAVTNDSADEPVYAAFAKTKQRDHAELVEWTLVKPGPGAAPYSFERYVRDVHHIEGAPPLDAALPEITVAMPSRAEELVVHAKFGTGRVTSRHDGKVTVAFADATRTLAEAFVKPASSGAGDPDAG